MWTLKPLADDTKLVRDANPLEEFDIFLRN